MVNILGIKSLTMIIDGKNTKLQAEIACKKQYMYLDNVYNLCLYSFHILKKEIFIYLHLLLNKSLKTLNFLILLNKCHMKWCLYTCL